MTRAQRAMFARQLVWHPEAEALTCRIRAEHQLVTITVRPYGRISGLWPKTPEDRIRETIAGEDTRFQKLRRIVKKRSSGESYSALPLPIAVWLAATSKLQRLRARAKPENPSGYKPTWQRQTRIREMVSKRLGDLVHQNPRYQVLPEILSGQFVTSNGPSVWGRNRYGHGYITVNCTTIPRPGPSGWIIIGKQGEELRFNPKTLQFFIEGGPDSGGD